MTTSELSIGEWIDRCTSRLMALDPHNPMDATDWDDVSFDLWAAEPRRAPETAAEEWNAMHGLVRVVTP